MSDTTTPAETMPAAFTPARIKLETSSGVIVVDGYADDTRRWNGYVTPALSAASVAALAEQMRPEADEALIVLTPGVGVTVTDPNYPDEPYTFPALAGPAGEPVYVFDCAWTFDTAELDDEAANLLRQHDTLVAAFTAEFTTEDDDIVASPSDWERYDDARLALLDDAMTVLREHLAN
jgi:hypothetical protein